MKFVSFVFTLIIAFSIPTTLWAVSDFKVSDYGKKNEVNLLQHTLHAAGVKVLYFSREEAKDFSYEQMLEIMSRYYLEF